MRQRFGVFEALDSIRRDLTHALRSLAKDRGFTLICVISLGIGIGAMVALTTFTRAITAPARGINTSGLAEVLVLPQGPLRVKAGVWALEQWSYPDYLDLRDANTGITVSNSGLNSPLPDMIKYLNFLIGDPKKTELYEGVLKRSSLEEMWRPQIHTESDANGNKGFTTDIGLIYFLDTTLGPRHIGHGGDQNGFISYIDFDPDRREASVIIFNTNVVLPDNTPPEKDMVGKLRRAVRALF